MTFYAQPRMTRDIDLVVELGPADASRLVAAFESDFDCDLEEVSAAVNARRMFNFIHVERVVKVDFIVRKEAPFRVEEFKRRRMLKLGEVPIWVVSPEDLLLSKLVWAQPTHSELQLRDIRNILVSVTSLDWGYLRRWAGDLGVDELLAEARQ